MTEKKEETKADPTELSDKELDKAQGGYFIVDIKKEHRNKNRRPDAANS